MTRRRIKTYPPLTPEQQRMVSEHSWIAGRLAHGAMCMTGGNTGCFTRDDLESVGNFALCVAATRYKPEMKYKYSTYAWITVRGYMQHALRDFSRMVRTPRWIGSYKKSVSELIESGKTYQEVAVLLGIDETKVIMCEMSAQNYHVSYDSQPDDWATPEFVYDFEEHKATLLSPELASEIKTLTDAEMTMLIKYVEEADISEEEREWAAEKFFELQNIAYGIGQRLSD